MELLEWVGLIVAAQAILTLVALALFSINPDDDQGRADQRPPVHQTSPQQESQGLLAGDTADAPVDARPAGKHGRYA